MEMTCQDRINDDGLSMSVVFKTSLCLCKRGNIHRHTESDDNDTNLWVKKRRRQNISAEKTFLFF